MTHRAVIDSGLRHAERDATARRPTTCPRCQSNLMRATDGYIVVCSGCGADFAVDVPNDYLLAEGGYYRPDAPQRAAIDSSPVAEPTDRNRHEGQVTD